MTEHVRLAVLGHPAAHSLSPVMHQVAYRALGLTASYSAIDVLPNDLPRILENMNKQGYRGVNLTIPHKEVALSFMTQCSPSAKRIGAVNTVTCRDDQLFGDNTDGEGWLSSFRAETGADVFGMYAVVIGAGGASRAIVDALLANGCQQVTLVNRTLDRAMRLQYALQVFYDKAKLKICSLNDVDLDAADLVVNTTSVGLVGELQDQIPLPLDTLRAGTIVSDIVYRPRRTKFLKEAFARGATMHEGIGMLVHQGALAIQQWFDVSAPIGVMRTAVCDVLDESKGGQ